MDCDLMRYVVNKEIIPLYLDSAKTFMSLSSGALALTVIFREKVIGSKPGTRVGHLMIASWLLFLLAIGSSASYQYFGTKFLDSVSCCPGPIQHFESLVRNPGRVYGCMLVFFFAGSALLVAAAWKQLKEHRG